VGQSTTSEGVKGSNEFFYFRGLSGHVLERYAKYATRDTWGVGILKLAVFVVQVLPTGHSHRQACYRVCCVLCRTINPVYIRPAAYKSPFCLATMSLSRSHARVEQNTDDSASDRPSRSSSRTPTNETRYHMSSRQSIQSDQGSISNSSGHNNVSVDDNDSLRLSREGLTPRVSRNFSVSASSDRDSDSSDSDHKSSSKSASRHRNQSQSTIRTTLGAGSDTLSTTASSTLPLHKFGPLSASSVQGSVPSSLRSPRLSLASTPSLATDPSPSPSPVYGLRPRPFNGSSTNAYDESLLKDPINGSSTEGYNVDLLEDSTSHSGTATAKGKKGILGFMTNFLRSNKQSEISLLRDPVNVPHVDFDTPGKFKGLPEVQDSRTDDNSVPTVNEFLCHFS
jgi:p21-activated kinase 1